MRFQGFGKGLPDFLFSLQFNNSQAALEENKARYRALLYEPMTRLYEDLTLAAMDVDPTLDTRKARCVAPMLRDMRYCHDSPMKDYGMLHFRVPGREDNQLSVFFWVDAESYGYGLYIFKPTTEGMATLRQGALRQAAAFQKAIKKLPEDYQVSGSMYKRDHYPQVASPLKDMLNIRLHLGVWRMRPLSDVLYSPDLVEEVTEGFRTLAPMYHLLYQALYT